MIFYLRTIVLSFLVNSLFSCNLQNLGKAQNSHQKLETEIGDTVKKLGNHLWYIYQDKKNNYWFSSNGEGVYKYDGKTI